MSCTPTSTGSFLSPSDESNFVPRSSDSVVDASSVTEHLFTAAKQSATIDGEKSSTIEEAVGASASGSGIATIQDAKKEPAVVADDEKSATGIVGATICFTPDSSPRSTPKPGRDLLNPNPFGGSSNEYIGSINGVESGESKLGSSAMHVASSLEGLSTTEYEMLDGISSKGTIEVEELIVDSEDEDVKTQGSRNSAGRRVAEKLATLSPCSTVASDTPFKMLKTPHPPEKETVNAPGVDQPLTPTRPKAPKLDLKAAAGDATKNEDQKDDKQEPKSNQDDTSPKVDGRPLTPFGNLHKYWEGQTIIARILKRATAPKVTEEPEEAADNPNADGMAEYQTPVNAKNTRTTGGQSFTFEGIVDEETEEYNDQSIPVAFSLSNAKEVLSGFVSTAVSFIASVAIIIGMFLYGHISSGLGKLSAIFGHILLGKLMKGMSMKNGTIEESHIPETKTCTDETSPEDLLEPSGTNLSKLFADESVEEESKLGLATKSGVQPEANDQEEVQDGVAASDQNEEALLQKIKDKIFGFILSKCSKALSVLPSSSTFLYAMVSCALIGCISMISYMPQISMTSYMPHISIESFMPHCAVTPRANVNVKDELYMMQQSLQSFKDEDLRCLLTQTMSFASVPLWQVNLSPYSFEAFDAHEEDTTAEQQSYWLFTFIIMSIMISFGSAWIFKPKIRMQIPFHHLIKPATEDTPKTVTGIWTEEEHEQFLAGYNVHGKSWKLVSAFVPSRTPTQVKTHGSYWLKIRSPEHMKKTRKSATPTPVKTPVKRERKFETPSSASSTKSTPRKSNRSKLNGILITKDSNQLHKSVTPRSEQRARRMKERKAPKSDPVKKRVSFSGGGK